MQVVAEFVTSAAGAGDFPRDRLPEVAMVGRSNVGKSTLINALVRTRIARVSAEPGKTRLANFYRVRRGSSPAMFLVDLPGYGYARRESGAQSRDDVARAFTRLTDAYFARGMGQPGGTIPMGVVLLVDSRHPGLESDLEAWQWLTSTGQPCAVVGTKADKLSRAERTRHAREFERMFARPVPLLSAVSGEGLEELWKLIARLPNQTAA